MKAAADVVAHAAKRHCPQCLRDHGKRLIVAGARVFAQQKQQLARPRKLRRIAKPAAPRVVRLQELLKGPAQRVLVRRLVLVLPARHHRQAIDDFAR